MKFPEEGEGGCHAMELRWKCQHDVENPILDSRVIIKKIYTSHKCHMVKIVISKYWRIIFN